MAEALDVDQGRTEIVRGRIHNRLQLLIFRLEITKQTLTFPQLVLHEAILAAVPQHSQGHRHGQQQRPPDHGSSPRLPAQRHIELGPVHLGDDAPWRVRDAADRGQGWHTTVVDPFYYAFLAQHEAHGWDPAICKGKSQVQGCMGTMPKLVQVHDVVALSPDQERLRTAAGCRPGLDKGKEEGGRINLEQEHPHGSRPRGILGRLQQGNRHPHANLL